MLLGYWNLDVVVQKLALITLFTCLTLEFCGSLAQAIDSSLPATITGTDATGKTTILYVDRNPALYTGDFGDCMGGQSLINLTSFDAAYYADNMTVLFNMAGTTNLRNESLMIHISVQAYGQDRFNLVFNPCNANFASLCPLNISVPIRGQALIPVSRSDVANIPNIALNIPDFEGSAILRVFSNSSQTQIGCFSAVMRNGSSLSHPGFIGSFLVLFTIIGILVSFATAIWGEGDIPEMRAHYAHSLPVLVIFEVFQSIFFSGALSLDWPSILTAWWSNFALFSGMIYSSKVVNSLNNFIGISGNSSQVGGAGSIALNNNGGLQQQIYGRSLAMKARDLLVNINDIKKHIDKRATSNENDPRLYNWAGLPVSPGLPLPGNWSGFAGELSIVGLPAADAFLNGVIWLLIFNLILCASLITMKYALESLCSIKFIKNDCLSLFRSKWLEFLGQALLRASFISFFMIMTLALFQFSYGGRAGVIIITVIIFVVLLGGLLAIGLYAYSYGNQYNRFEVRAKQYKIKPPKIINNLLNHDTSHEGKIRKENEQSESSAFGSYGTEEMVVVVNNESEISNIHYDIEYTKRFGWLSARFRHTRWWYFGVWAIYQFFRACLVGGARSHPIVQVTGLFVWEVLALIAMALINPWEGTRNTVLAVWMLGISKIVTSGLSIAFLPQLHLARVPSTVIGIFIIITQGLLVIALLILIVLGAISSYMSLSRSHQQFKPEKLKNIRLKYLAHIDSKVENLSSLATAEEPEKPREPYFSVNHVRREPKIEDETPNQNTSFYNFNASYTSLSRYEHNTGKFSRVDNIPESDESQPLKYGSPIYGSHRKHNKALSRDLDDVQLSQSSRAGTPIGSVRSYNKMINVPLIRPSTPVTSIRSVMPSTEQQMQFASQRVKNTK
ncbi:putative transient receptor potential ion channel [Erysiphe necator]|uniref:Putative transient receptor potential ion channel n=1 Tax=Uncinula necator TaxID=52586 RepID=A0A0B1PB08_UNCNE|nr:putative transient receptor potential ion channel [Erysiphe necator]